MVKILIYFALIRLKKSHSIHPSIDTKIEILYFYITHRIIYVF